VPFWSAYQAVKKENEDILNAHAITKETRKEVQARRRMVAEERRQGQIAKSGASVGLHGSSPSTAGGIVKKRNGKAKEIWKPKNGGCGHGDDDVEMEVD
jgi:hypothetical protein